MKANDKIKILRHTNKKWIGVETTIFKVKGDYVSAFMPKRATPQIIPVSDVEIVEEIPMTDAERIFALEQRVVELEQEIQSIYEQEASAAL